jgi:SNF2 family DNA or RNA helicase
VGATAFTISKGHIFFYQSPEVASRLTVFFPGMKSLPMEDGNVLCAIPHTLDACRILANVGKEIESPIEHGDYDWPGIFTPAAHQKRTAGFLTLHKRAFCLNGMGAMKTATTVWACDYLMGKGDVKRVLVTSPLSVIDVWAREIFKVAPHRKFVTVYGSREKRRELLRQPADFYIINHDGIEIIAKDLAEMVDIDHFVIDEVACFRNRTTKKWKVLNSLVNGQIPRSIWGLTGTPTPNEPTDAYAQMRLIKPENFRGNFNSFRDSTMIQVGTYRWIPRKGSEQKVNDILKPSIRYALEDCTDLPPTIYSDRQCELSQMQKFHFDKLIKEAITTVRETQVTAVNAGVLLNKLVQAACGCLYGANSEVLELDFGPRLALLTEIIEECNEKVIVFVPLTGVLDALYEKLHLKWSVAMVDGRTPHGQRKDIFKRFQETKSPHVLLANAGTMAHGLTLTAASTIIWYAPISSNDHYNQANARIVRPGQRNITNIVRMYATPTEQRIYKALDDRSALQDIVLNLAKSA